MGEVVASVVIASMALSSYPNCSTKPPVNPTASSRRRGWGGCRSFAAPEQNRRRECQCALGLRDSEDCLYPYITGDGTKRVPRKPPGHAGFRVIDRERRNRRDRQNRETKSRQRHHRYQELCAYRGLSSGGIGDLTGFFCAPRPRSWSVVEAMGRGALH